MKKKENDLPLYLVFGGLLAVFVLLLAGNLAYYKGTGINGIMLALNDLGRFKFHIGFSEIYLQYYGASFLIASGLSAYFIINEQQYRHDAAGIEGGSSNWHNNLADFSKKYADPIGKKSNNGPMNMIVSKNVKISIEDFKIPLPNLNVLIIGGAGTGKSRCVIKPNVLQENCSFVITDPSGELLASLGTELKNAGYVIKVFNLVNMEFSNQYNPFVYIRDDAGIGILVDCFISNTSPPDQKGEKFWEDSEKALLTASIYFLKDFCDKKEQNFSMLLYMVQLAQFDENSRGPVETKLDKLFEGKAVIKDGAYVELSNLEEIKIRKSRLENSLAWKNYQTFRLAGARTAKSILISAAVRLNPFNIPAIANLTSRDTLELDQIGDRKTAMFCIIPQANSTYNFLASMMFSQAFESLYYKAEHSKASDDDPDQKYLRLKHHVRFMMDEFKNIGKIPQFPEKIATMRKYNISVTIVLQSLAQIVAMYKDDYETIVGNCSVNILLGTQEKTTEEYFSKQIGKTTIRARSVGLKGGKAKGSSFNYQQTGRELMTIDEIRTMSNNDCLILVASQKPFRDQKYPLETHPRYKFTGDYKDEFRYDLLKSDEFNNVKVKTYESTSKEKDEPEHAKDLISSPQNAQDVEIHVENDTEREKFEAIMEIDRASVAKYIAVCAKRLQERINLEKRNKPDTRIYCIIDEIIDHRTAKSLCPKLFKDNRRSIIIFCNVLTLGYLEGYYIEKEDCISAILKDMGFTQIETIEQYAGETFSIVHNVKQECFDEIHMRMVSGMKEDTTGEILDRFIDQFGLNM